MDWYNRHREYLAFSDQDALFINRHHDAEKASLSMQEMVNTTMEATLQPKGVDQL